MHKEERRIWMPTSINYQPSVVLQAVFLYSLMCLALMKKNIRNSQYFYL